MEPRVRKQDYRLPIRISEWDIDVEGSVPLYPLLKRYSLAQMKGIQRFLLYRHFQDGFYCLGI